MRGRAHSSKNGDAVVTAVAVDGGSERVVPGLGVTREDGGLWFPDADPEGSYFAQATEDGSSVIRPFDSDEVMYRAPEGWSIRAVSDDATQAVIKEGPGFGDGRVRLVSTSDDTGLDLDAESVGVPWFSPDGSLVALGNEQEVGIAFYDTATGIRLLDFGSTPYGGLAAAFTRDGSKFVVGGFAGQVFVFDVESLLSDAPIEDALEVEIAAHDTLILGVVVSPDGSNVATWGRDEPLKVWDIELGEPAGQFGPGGLDGVHIGDFHPSDPYLMVTSPPNVVRIHTLDIDELVAIAESRLSREMTDSECQQYFREPCPTS